MSDYAVEHFLPYAFVSHDLMWNLIPADRSFNSSKSDKLPPLERYFEPYYDIGFSWEMFHQLELEGVIESYKHIDPNGIYPPVRAVKMRHN